MKRNPHSIYTSAVCWQVDINNAAESVTKRKPLDPSITKGLTCSHKEPDDRGGS